MPDYQQGKIYTIRCRTDDTLIYVGSTIQSLAVRWGGHNKDSRKESCKNMLLYKTINGNWSDWYIELHSFYPCNCVQELKRKEGEIIREIGTLNSNIAGRTNNEWIKDNKEHISEYNKKYKKEYEADINNINKIKEYKKKYYLKKKAEKLNSINTP